MTPACYDLHSTRILHCVAEGPPLQNDLYAVDLISQALEHRAALIAISTERLAENFFRLKTPLAGEILQKFLTYNLRVPVVGDISRYRKESSAFRDFVAESNRGDRIWFVANFEELAQRLNQTTHQA